MISSFKRISHHKRILMTNLFWRQIQFSSCDTLTLQSNMAVLIRDTIFNRDIVLTSIQAISLNHHNLSSQNYNTYTTLRQSSEQQIFILFVNGQHSVLAGPVIYIYIPVHCTCFPQYFA